MGRRREVDALTARAVRGLDGESGIVVVAGPPGIGKSTLVDVVLAPLRGRDPIEVRHAHPDVPGPGLAALRGLIPPALVPPAPHVVVLEDLERLPLTALLALPEAVEGVHDARLLVIAQLCTTEDTPAAVHRMLEDPRLEVTRLRPLSSRDVEEMVVSAGLGAPGSRVSRAVQRATDGNPGLVRALVDTLVAEGAAS